jgi:hypothetical protein
VTGDVVTGEVVTGEVVTGDVNVATGLGQSARAEWEGLVTAAVLGTDRRAVPAAAAGWHLREGDDPAVALLDRVAAVTVSRRAGAVPGPPVAVQAPAPADPRPVVPPRSAANLARMLRGEHDVALAEWLDLCAAGGWRPPPELVPALLLRGKRDPAFDAAVRRVIGSLAAWLADAVPSLGVRANAAKASATFAPVPSAADSAAVVDVVVAAFHDHSATWASVAGLRTMVASLDRAALAELIGRLNAAPFHVTTERARVELLGLAQLRRDLGELVRSPSDGVTG